MTPGTRPRGSWQPLFNSPPATLWLAGALVACYGLSWLLPDEGQGWVISRLAFIPVLFLSQFSPEGPGLSLPLMLPLLTHTLLHADLTHLLVNVGMLMAFGAVLERSLGPTRYLIIFFATAAVGALTLTWWVGAQPVVMIGASGGVYGLMGAAMRFLFSGGVGNARRGAITFAAAILGLNLVMALVGMGGLIAAANIAWQAHVGGFVAGIVFAQLIRR